MRAAIVGVCFVLCATAADAQTRYELIAYAAPGMDPADQTVIIPDARRRLPQLLRSCGIRRFRNVAATDGAVVYRFEADPNGRAVACLRKTMPPGGRLQS